MDPVFLAVGGRVRVVTGRRKPRKKLNSVPERLVCDGIGAFQSISLEGSLQASTDLSTVWSTVNSRYSDMLGGKKNIAMARLSLYQIWY